MRIKMLLFSTFFSFLLIASNAPAEEVTKNTDSGSSGEVRQIIELINYPNAVVTFAPGVNPDLNAGAIQVNSQNLKIKGNIDGKGDPSTVISRASVSSGPIFSISGAAGNGLSLESLIFRNITRQTGNLETLGGGVISAVNASDALGASLGNIANTEFNSAKITLGGSLGGAGLVGVYSSTGPASIGNVDALFYNNQITLTNDGSAEQGRIWGAGLLGASAKGQSSSIGHVSGEFVNNTVKTATYINGAGLVGSFVESLDQVATVGNVSANFTGNRVIANTNLSGGGLAGSWSWVGSVVIGDVSGVFQDNIVTAASSYMRGGGIVGLRSYKGYSSLGTVSAAFIDNHITVGTSLGGGGIIGLYSADTFDLGNRDNDKTSSIAAIGGASFIGNTVNVGSLNAQNVYALGGVVAVSGLNEELVINNTVFKDNKLSITGRNIWDLGGGAFYVGTDRNSANLEGHVLTISASEGKTTEFRNNTIYITQGGNSVLRNNSITFSREWDGVTNTVLSSKADAQLNISPQTGGKIILLDPVKVNMDNNKTFTMNIDGSGYFLWNGSNQLDADNSLLNFTSGATELAPGFQALRQSGSGDFRINMGREHTLLINTTGRASSLAMFQRPDHFTVTGAPALQAMYYGVDSTSGKEWLITNNRDAAGVADFTLTQTELFGVALRAEADNLYLSIDNSRAISPFTASPNPNVDNAYRSGALVQAWNDAITKVDADKMGMVFADARQNPASLTGEAMVSQGIAALRTNRSIIRQSLEAAGLGKAGSDYTMDIDSVKLNLWANYIGSSSRQSEHAASSGYDSYYNGLVLGGSASWGDRVDTGIYLAYAKAVTDYDDISASVDTDILQAGIFARLEPLANFKLLADASYTWLDNDSERANALGINRGDFDQNILSSGISVRYDINFNANSTLSPFLGLRYQHLRQDDLEERGEGLAQKINSMNGDSLVSSLGLSLSHDFSVNEQSTVSLAGYASWNHEFADASLKTNSHFIGYDTFFDLSSIEQKRDTMELGTNLKADLMTGESLEFSLIGGYSVEFNDDYVGQVFYGGVNFVF